MAGATELTGKRRVWKLAELSILHQVPKPVLVVLNLLSYSETSGDGVQEFSRVWFQNDASVQAIGTAGAYLAVETLSDEKQRKRREYLRHAMEPILVESQPGHVQSAMLHLIEMDATLASHRRGAAMHDHNPFHSFMFDSRGHLLFVNQAGARSCHIDPAQPGNFRLKTLFAASDYTGGEDEAQAAYEEAMHAIFTLQLDNHRHTQQYKSKKDGRMKWVMIEMWPLVDPVSDTPAVLVKKNNITQQKELELQLSYQQAALQRHNQELEEDSATMSEEKEKLRQEADSLAKRLEAIMHDKFEPRVGFDADTPIDKTLNFLQNVIGGKVPSVEQALQLYHILSESNTNLRQPVRLEDQLLQSGKDHEVGQSMLQLLQGRAADVPKSSRLPGKAETNMAKTLSAKSWKKHVWMFGPAMPEPQQQTSDSTPQQQFPAAPQAASRDPPQASQGSGDPQQLPGGTQHTDGDPPAVGEGPEQASMELAEKQADAPMVSITPVVERYLQDAENNWQFDIFGFAEATQGHSLSTLTFHLLHSTGQIADRKYDAVKLARYIRAVEAGYRASNPYHNSIHVASVVQMTHMIMSHGGVMTSGAMGVVEQLASYWSALVHDFEHGGVNNDFLIKTLHPLAVTYNDQSPLENHHMAAAVRLYAKPELYYLSRDKAFTSDRRPVRSCSISQVLGTDMKKHFDITSRFQAAFKRQPANSVGSSEGGESSGVVDWDTVKAEDKALVHQMVLKCADIGHLTASVATHKRWAYQLEEEFFRQGDKERELGLPISPLMDRSHSGGMTRSQIGFFNIVGKPLFQAMADLFEGCQPMMDGVLANLQYWETLASEASAAAMLSSEL